MDGVNYEVVQIGSQRWFAENLRTEHFNDGTFIVAVGTSGLYSQSHLPHRKWLVSGLDSIQYYNLSAASNALGICPSGWHLPTSQEFSELVDFLGEEGHAGAEGLALADSSWIGTSDLGFNAVPHGAFDYYYYDSYSYCCGYYFFGSCTDYCYRYTREMRLQNHNSRAEWLTSDNRTFELLSDGTQVMGYPHGRGAYNIRCIQD